MERTQFDASTPDAGRIILKSRPPDKKNLVGGISKNDVIMNLGVFLEKSPYKCYNEISDRFARLRNTVIKKY